MVRQFQTGNKIVEYGSIVPTKITDTDLICKVYKNGKAKGVSGRKYFILMGKQIVGIPRGNTRCLSWGWKFDVI
jgi:hypothetical protein